MTKAILNKAPKPGCRFRLITEAEKSLCARCFRICLSKKSLGLPPLPGNRARETSIMKLLQNDKVWRHLAEKTHTHRELNLLTAEETHCSCSKS